MPTNSPHPIEEEEKEPVFYFRNLLQQLVRLTGRAFQNWLLIVLVAAIGFVLGIGYSFIKSRTYTAHLSFVVEDPKSTGSLASAVVGQLGMDFSSLGSSSGIIGGDNMLELLKSSHFIKSTLLTPYCDSGDNGITLADRYASVYHLKEKWEHSDEINRAINFNALKNKPSRLEDSLLQLIILQLTEKDLLITKPDKKLNIFVIETTFRDEKLAQLFCERLLQITTDFYIDTKIGRLKRNEAKLQSRADSIYQLLNRQTAFSTSENSKLIDLNPVYAASFVNAEISTRNKMLLSTIYAEVVKNLEVTKTALMQETPTVQIIDHPELPLKINRTKWYLSAFYGLLTGFLGIVVLLLFIQKNPNGQMPPK